MTGTGLSLGNHTSFFFDRNLKTSPNAGGLGSVDGGLVIDLAPMRGIRVDPKNNSIRVQGGCRWGDVDHAAHAYGLAVPSGTISTTGVGGLTLGVVSDTSVERAG